MGQKHTLRNIYDSGSESTFVSESCMKVLGIKRENAMFPVKGLSNSKIAVTKGYVDHTSIHNADTKLSVKSD